MHPVTGASGGNVFAGGNGGNGGTVTISQSGLSPAGVLLGGVIFLNGGNGSLINADAGNGGAASGSSDIGGRGGNFTASAGNGGTAANFTLSTANGIILTSSISSNGGSAGSITGSAGSGGASFDGGAGGSAIPSNKAQSTYAGIAANGGNISITSSSSLTINGSINSAGGDGGSGGGGGSGGSGSASGSGQPGGVGQNAAPASIGAKGGNLILSSTLLTGNGTIAVLVALAETARRVETVAMTRRQLIPA